MRVGEGLGAHIRWEGEEGEEGRGVRCPPGRSAWQPSPLLHLPAATASMGVPFPLPCPPLAIAKAYQRSSLPPRPRVYGNVCSPLPDPAGTAVLACQTLASFFFYWPTFSGVEEYFRSIARHTHQEVHVP